MTDAVILLVAGFAIWLATGINSPVTDTVTMYTLTPNTPDLDALSAAYEKAPTALSNIITNTVMKGMAPTCLSPEGVQGMVWAGASPLALPNSNMSASAIQQMLLVQLNTNRIMTSPLCLCLKFVLDKYTTMDASVEMKTRVDSANKAFKACFSTNSQTPQQKQFYEVNYNTDKIHTRRTVSKVSFALIICLSLLFNVIYCSLNFETENFYTHTPNTIRLVSLIVIQIVQLFLPAVFSNAAHSSNILTITGIIITPALLIQFILMELAWAYLHAKNRAVHIHPYVFVTTLISLNAIALFETGAFEFNTFLYYIFISHALSVAYAATLFFSHFQKQDSVDTQSLTGYIILLAASTILIISCAIPSHPTNSVLNLMWLLPAIFTVGAFGFSILVEHTFQHAGKADDMLHKITSHMYSLGHSHVVVIVLVYFMLKLWRVSLGDTTLSNVGEVLPRLNFAFSYHTNPKIPSLYSVL